MTPRRLWTVERKKPGKRWELVSVLLDGKRRDAERIAAARNETQRKLRANFGGKPDCFRAVLYLPAGGGR